MEFLVESFLRDNEKDRERRDLSMQLDDHSMVRFFDGVL